MLGYTKHVSKTLLDIYKHPLNAHRRISAVAGFYRWRVGTRMIGIERKVVVPWVDSSRFLLGRDEHGLGGNMYVGLMDFPDMGFLLHAMRPDDLFVDVGANVGAYSILASSVVGARCLAFEPVGETASRLLDQVRLNAIGHLVDIRHEAVGSTAGELHFTQSRDVTNKVALQAGPDTTCVSVTTLDHAVKPNSGRLFIKMDVEGFEYDVIQGGLHTLSSNSVAALIVELNGSGEEFGHSNQHIHEELIKLGLLPVAYDPLSRRVTPLTSFNTKDGNNTIYVKDIGLIRALCQDAPARTIHTAGGQVI